MVLNTFTFNKTNQKNQNKQIKSHTLIFAAANALGILIILNINSNVKPTSLRGG